MLRKLKENYILRNILFKVFDGFETRRKIKSYNSKLLFNAGTNLNFFFMRELHIENEASANLLSLMKENFLIFDVGAHIGYYTVILSGLLKGGRIIAFEPDIENLKYLKKNIKENSLYNVTVVDKAVSNIMGDSLFYQDITTGRTSSLEVDAWHPKAAKTRQKVVQTITIDEAANQYGMPNIIKCDVEGHELNLLNGGLEVLRHKPVLFLEVSKGNRTNVFQILKKFNYKIFNAELSLSNQFAPLTDIDCPNILCY
jgi:FkbM family methyltransferase